MAVMLMSMMPDDGVMTKENGTYVINTTTLAADVEGYQSPTPLKIYIKKNKIEKIEALRNKETPKYFAMVKKNLLDKWNGMTVKKAATAEVDGVTGATFSSNAVKENVRRGLDYYKKHK
ncbi:MAG: FMN-binding protein [Prevotella sp.]|nr:FMN-binding protein [Prevotella sp.]